MNRQSVQLAAAPAPDVDEASPDRVAAACDPRNSIQRGSIVDLGEERADACHSDQ
jgi:hypothetical protein